MSRTTILILAGILACGSIVALLPAQESARRSASKGRESVAPGVAPIGPPPALAPPPGAAELPPVIQAANAGALRSQFGASPPNVLEQAATAAPAELAAPAAEAPGVVAPTDPAQPEDAGGLRSVLKRNRPPVIYESPAPPPTYPSANRAEPPAASNAAAPPAPPLQPVRQRSTAASAGGTTAARGAKEIAASARSPLLKVEVTGPQGVTVGKPADYAVTLINEGDTAAEDVQLRVLLPPSVAVQSSQPTSGETALQGDAQGRLDWSLPAVAARAREQLRLQLVTRDADAFDFGVEWVARPASVRTTVAVKRPQLELSLVGPADMTFGEEKAFTLTVSNPGTGDAERVVLSVAAAGAPPQQFDAGTIPAGHKKEVPLAVVASQPGTLDILVSASADTGLETQTSAKVTVRKAEVRVALEGPPLKYAGSEAIYLLTVANNGSAPADNISLSLALPAGARYLGGIDGAAAAGGNVKWKIGNIGPGGERTYEVRVQLTTAGVNTLAVQSQAAASGVASCEAQTEVEAVCDLKLVVNDPAGPVPVGEPAVYELQVINRGTQAARQVKIIMQFSEGIEPIAFEGCEARLVPGQVLCEPLPQLNAGEQVTLRIKAQADEAGPRLFRVEVTSTDGDVRLVSEGTTRFFSESRGSAAATARRPNLLPAPPMPTTLR